MISLMIRVTGTARSNKHIQISLVDGKFLKKEDRRSYEYKSEENEGFLGITKNIVNSSCKGNYLFLNHSLYLSNKNITRVLF